jgi:hypothetical protein
MRCPLRSYTQCGAPQLAAQLRSLSGLRRLRLEYLQLREACDDASSAQPLVQALTSLRRLTDLKLIELPDLDSAQLACLRSALPLLPLSCIDALSSAEESEL